MTLLNVTSAEIAKLRTLPVAVLVAVGTIGVGATIAAALAWSAATQDVAGGQDQAASAAGAVLAAIPYAQAGIILLGILPATHEHAGTQSRTSLTAVPHRGLFLVGKSISALIALAIAAVLTVGVSLAAAVIVQRLAQSSVSAAAAGRELGQLVGAAGYLILIGMLSHAVALLVRHLVPALVVMLTLVLIVPPLAGSVTEHARWLPDRAGSLLYRPGADAVLTTATGTLVLLGWIVVAGSVAVAQFVGRDA